MAMSHNDPELIIPDWPAPTHIGACFTTRVGGFSQAPYDSLNLGSHCGDQPQRVEQNRGLLTSRLGLENPPVWLNQVHGTDCIRVPEDLPQTHADAAWTNLPGICCAVLTADCLPVLVTDTAGSLVAAIHAGWRGLAAGVIESCIARLPVMPGHLLAWIGPAIGPANYEVDDTVRTAFIASTPGATDCFEARCSGHWLADLPALARLRLQRLGVRQISGGEYCTAAEGQRFFSYRRDGICGRMAALIWIKTTSNSCA